RHTECDRAGLRALRPRWPLLLLQRVVRETAGASRLRGAPGARARTRFERKAPLGSLALRFRRSTGALQPGGAGEFVRAAQSSSTAAARSGYGAEQTHG